MRIKIDYKPYNKQKLFHDSNHKFRAFIGGLGSGKTLAGSAETIKTMLEYPKCLGAILAPTYPLLRDSTIKTLLGLIPRELIKNYNRSEQMLKLINGAEVIFRPCDDINSIDRLRNINLGWWWIDEASLTLYYVYKVLLGRLRDGRGPMRGWITTTPKGFNWIWKKWVDEPTKNHFMVTSSSRDNPYLPEGYIEAMQEEYTGVFARQEIEGMFVGHEGLVYPEFNREIHVIDTSKIKLKEFVIGVDFGFTNPSAVVKIGFDYDGRVYITKEFYERHFTDAELAEMCSKSFGNEMYIADSANPSGIEEFNKIGLECRGVRKVSGEREESFIISGIKKVSSLLQIQKDGKPRLFVDRNCINTIMEFENYRYPESKDERPLQEKPLKVHDHCLIGDTIVTTKRGNVKIKEVNTNDYVLTRKGWKKVLWAGMTKLNAKILEVSFNNGQKLKGTPEHLVFVKNRGFIGINALSNTYILETLLDNTCLKKSHLMELLLDNGVKDTMGDCLEKKELNTYTEKSGNSIKEKYQKDSLSTTKTETKKTMTYPISNVLHKKNIIENTQKNIVKNISIESDHSQKYGMEAKKEKNGTVNMQKKDGRKESRLSKIVFHAGKNIKILQEGITPNSVLQNAKCDNTDVKVVSIKEAGKSDVYNIHVKDCHEFYANGILVHNCMDAIRYVLIERVSGFEFAVIRK